MCKAIRTSATAIASSGTKKYLVKPAPPAYNTDATKYGMTSAKESRFFEKTGVIWD